MPLADIPDSAGAVVSELIKMRLALHSVLDNSMSFEGARQDGPVDPSVPGLYAWLCGVVEMNAESAKQVAESGIELVTQKMAQIDRKFRFNSELEIITEPENRVRVVFKLVYQPIP